MSTRAASRLRVNVEATARTSLVGRDTTSDSEGDVVNRGFYTWVQPVQCPCGSI